MIAEVEKIQAPAESKKIIESLIAELKAHQQSAEQKTLTYDKAGYKAIVSIWHTMDAKPKKQSFCSRLFYRSEPVLTESIKSELEIIANAAGKSRPPVYLRACGAGPS